MSISFGELLLKYVFMHGKDENRIFSVNNRIINMVVDTNGFSQNLVKQFAQQNRIIALGDTLSFDVGYLAHLHNEFKV